MTYFADNDFYYYNSGSHDADNWNCPLLAIGWLDQPNEYITDISIANGFLAKLTYLRKAFAEAFSSESFRGLHECTLCQCDEGERTLIDSHINLFVPGKNCVFVAPGRIDHYIEKHGYCPPKVFYNAVMQCPDPRGSKYDRLLKLANGDIEPPFQRNSW
jgi:hypothetical protein